MKAYHRARADQDEQDLGGGTTYPDAPWWKVMEKDALKTAEDEKKKEEEKQPDVEVIEPLLKRSKKDDDDEEDSGPSGFFPTRVSVFGP